MQQLLCEPEDRLGSQTSASASRPNSIVVQSRRSGFIPQQPGVSAENDGAHLIKVLEHLHGDLPAPSHFYAGPSLVQGDRLAEHPQIPRALHTGSAQPGGYSTLRLRYPTRGVSINHSFFILICSCVFQPLAPANGAPPDATKDPLLKHKIHGAEILHVRKALAFAGFTHKSPRTIEYTRAEKAFETTPKLAKGTTVRGRPLVRETRDIGLGRAISM